MKLTRVGGTTLIRSVAGFYRINLVTPDINQCRVNAVPVVDLSRWYICYRKRCVSPPFRERERDLHGTFHPGRCGVINHRTRPKSCATAEACVVLRTEFADIRLRVFKLHRHFHDFFLRDGVRRHGLLCHGSLSFALIEICPKRAQNRFFAFMIGSRFVRFRAVTLRCQTGDYIFLCELTDEYGWKSRMNCMT